jgi:hypothetical protein
MVQESVFYKNENNLFKKWLFDDYHLPEDDNHHSHRHGNLKSSKLLFVKKLSMI